MCSIHNPVSWLWVWVIPILLDRPEVLLPPELTIDLSLKGGGLLPVSLRLRVPSAAFPGPLAVGELLRQLRRQAVAPKPQRWLGRSS